MSQLDGKWVSNDTLNGTKIRLANDQSFRARNNAGGGDIPILKVNTSDIPVFETQPQFNGTPTANDDLVNRGYVLDVLSGVRDPKDACQLASTGANLTLSGEQTIDGTLTSTSRILVKDQTDASENGIYDTAAGAWARASDANTSAEVTSGMSTIITEGTLNARKLYVLTTADPITLDTTNLTFAQAPNPANFLVPAEEAFTLAAGDITNGYVDLAQEAEAASVTLTPKGGPEQEHGIDFTLSVVSNVTRVTFAGDLATLAAATDVLLVNYLYATS